MEIEMFSDSLQEHQLVTQQLSTISPLARRMW